MTYCYCSHLHDALMFCIVCSTEAARNLVITCSDLNEPKISNRQRWQIVS
jgi:hypothetical protein